MAEDSDRTGTETAAEQLIREIREEYTYFRDYWRENQEEAKIDLRFVSGDPWDPEARREREDNGRPIICPDELDQYLNATINNLRQNPRAIKIDPAGEDATDKDATRRQSIIRAIEYRSNAQAAYTNAFENAINCGFGYFRVTTKVTGKDGEQEPRIRIIENPISVLPDPNAKESDFSDQEGCFVLDVMRIADFKKKYPKAERQSFSPEDMSSAPGWFESNNVIVAEYWKRILDKKGNTESVTQYITNGLEVLETNKWVGSWIPIVPVVGKIVYVPVGGALKRMFYSMIRKARGPQMMLAYIASQEAEEFGMAPRAPFVGYVGQFETDKDSWEMLNKVPRAFVQVDPMVDNAGGQLPLPTRPAFTPNAQQYEIAFERWRRSTQSAMGISPLPTPAQQQNEKSGVALERIQTQQAIGAYHFTDNFNRSLENAGRQLNELITLVMDTPRQIGVRDDDETHSLLHVIPGGRTPVEGMDTGADTEDIFDPTKGEFDVTISTGPSYQSQREEASDYVSLLVQQIAALPIPPPAKATILSLGTKLKNLGPIGDQIAKVFDPQGDGEPVPPQAQAMIGQLQQQLQQAHQMGQGLYQKVQELDFEKKAGVVKAQNEYAIEKLKIEAQVTSAEINTKAQSMSERITFVHDMLMQLVGQKHEAAMGAAEAQQAQQVQAAQVQAQSAQSSQNAQQQATQSAQDATQQQLATPAQGE